MTHGVELHQLQSFLRPGRPCESPEIVSCELYNVNRRSSRHRGSLLDNASRQGSSVAAGLRHVVREPAALLGVNDFAAVVIKITNQRLL